MLPAPRKAVILDGPVGLEAGGMKKSALVSILFALLAFQSSDASTPPAGFTETLLVSDDAVTGASVTIGIAYEPGTGNLWVLEKGDGSGGANQARVRIRSAASGAMSTALTLNCVDHVGERGLLGIAFSPDYLAAGGASRFVYLYYTRLITATGACSISGYNPRSRNRVLRFTASGQTLINETVLLEGPELSLVATNHNGGTLRFAPDKTLFISMGDNDTDADAAPASRDLTDLKGKMLRINGDGTIPANNPFVRQAGVRREIWAWGLRNPFRFSIDSQTSDVYIADVGENTWEEIDLGAAGADYGYPCFEGPSTFRACNPPASSPTPPIYSYDRNTGRTVIAGPVYRATAFPAEYRGYFFFGDYAFSWIRRGRLDVNGQLTDVQMFIPNANQVVDMAVSPAGCLTWVSIGGDGVRNVCFSGADLDGDGFTTGQGDCNDQDATSRPGAVEVCDGNNNDCQGGVPSNEADSDGDGYVLCSPWNDVQGDNPAVQGGADNCPTVSNASQSDFDDDGFGDACETGVTLADIDQSLRVDGFDFARLARAFGSACAQPRYDAPSDLNFDCAIDGDDLALLAAQFGKSRPAS